MTHENPKQVVEAEGGPEHTHDLPDAAEVPEFDSPESSFASPLDGDLED